MKKNKDTELRKLIRKYYPKSERYADLIRDINANTTSKCWLTTFIILGVLYISLEHTLNTGSRVSSGILLSTIVIFIIYMNILAMMSQSKIDPIEDGEISVRFIVVHLRIYRAFNKLLKNPYSPQLILGTIEGIEATLSAQRESAEGRISDYQTLLFAREKSIEGVREDISARLQDRTLDESRWIIDGTRLLEAENTLEDISKRFKHTDWQLEQIPVLLEPAYGLIGSLRSIYRDSYETGVIASGKAAVAYEGHREAIEEEVMKLQSEAVRAGSELEFLVHLVGVQLDAEEEANQAFGILPKDEEIQV